MKVFFSILALLLVGARPMGTVAGSHNVHDSKQIALGAGMPPLEQELLVNAEGIEALSAHQRPRGRPDWSGMLSKAKLPALLLGAAAVAFLMVAFLGASKKERPLAHPDGLTRRGAIRRPKADGAQGVGKTSKDKRRQYRRQNGLVEGTKPETPISPGITESPFLGIAKKPSEEQQSSEGFRPSEGKGEKGLAEGTSAPLSPPPSAESQQVKMRPGAREELPKRRSVRRQGRVYSDEFIVIKSEEGTRDMNENSEED